MKKEKNKKKKSSQTDCESSSTTKDSHGTKINHEQNPDTPECTCLTKPQRSKRFLQCFKRTDTPPDCPVHSSKDSTVRKEPKSKEKQEDTTRQPGLVRRIGRWILKKVTKGRKEEKFPYELLESRSASVCLDIEPEPELQITGKLDLGLYGPEEFTHTSTTTDNCAEPDDIVVTTAVDVSPKTSRNTVMSLKDLCFAVADKTSSKTTDINGSKQDIVEDVEQPKEKKTELDQNDMEPECEKGTVMSQAAVAHSDALKQMTDDITTDLTEEHNHQYTDNPELDDTSESSDDSVLMTLTQLCKKVISNIECEKNTDTDATAIVTDEAAEAHSDTLKQITDDITTDLTEEHNHQDTDNPELDDTSESSDDSVLMTLTQLCKKVISNIECEKNTDTDATDIVTAEAAEAHSDALKQITDDITTDLTEDQNHQDTDNPELDDTSESSDDSVLMTLTQLCKKVISNIECEKNTDIDATDIVTDEDINLECDANKLLSLKDLCTAALKSPNAESVGMIDTKNDGSETKGINESKQDTAYDETHPVENNTELGNDDKKPECDKITVRSLKVICEAAVTYPDDSKQHTYDTKTDHTEEQDNHNKENPELDDISINSKIDDDVLMTLTQLCTEVVISANDEKPTNKSNMDNTKVVDLFTECVNPECDAKEMMSLKDICTAAVRAFDAKNPGVVDTKITGCNITDITDSKQDLASKETQSILKKTELDNTDTKQEYGQIQVTSLREICKETLTHPDVENYNTEDTNHTEEIDDQDNQDTNYPELDNVRVRSESDDGALTTLIQLCTNMVSSANDKKSIDTDDKDIANEAIVYTNNVNLDNEARQLMSLKDLCTAAVKNANTEGEVDTVKSSENGRKAKDATKYGNTGMLSLTEICKAAIRNECGLKTDVRDKTSEQVHIELLCKPNDSKEINVENKLNFPKNTAKTLKEICSMTIGNAEDTRARNNDTLKEQNYEKDNQMSKELQPNNYDYSGKFNNASAKSLKEICMEFIRNFHDTKTNLFSATEDQISDYISDKDSSYMNEFKVENIEVNRTYYRKEAKSFKQLCREVMKLPDKPVNHDINFKSRSDLVRSLKELCSAAVGITNEEEKDTKTTKQFQFYQKEHQEVYTERGHVGTKCDRTEANSSKDFCMTAVRYTNTSDAEAGIVDTYTDKDHAQDTYPEESYNYGPYNSDVSPKSDNPLTQEPSYGTFGNGVDIDTVMQDIDDDNVLVDIPCDKTVNFEIDQERSKIKSKCKQEAQHMSINGDNLNMVIATDMGKINEPRRNHSNKFTYQLLTDDNALKSVEKGNIKDYSDAITGPKVISDEGSNNTNEGMHISSDQDKFKNITLDCDKNVLDNAETVVEYTSEEETQNQIQNQNQKEEVKTIDDEMELLPIGIWVKKGKWCHTEDMKRQKKTNGDFIVHKDKELTPKNVDTKAGKIHDDDIERLLMDIWVRKSMGKKVDNIKMQNHAFDVPAEENYELKQKNDSFDTVAKRQYNPDYEIVKLPMGIWVKKIRKSCVDNVKAQNQTSGSYSNQFKVNDDDEADRHIVNTESRVGKKHTNTDDEEEEKLTMAMDVSKDVMRDIQLAETQSENDTNQVETVDQTLVHDTAERVQKTENHNSKETTQDLARNKESKGTVCRTSPEKAIRCEHDDEADCQLFTSGTDIDKAYEARQALSDNIDISQINDTNKKDGNGMTKSSIDDLKDTAKIKARKDKFTEKLPDNNVEQHISDEKDEADDDVIYSDMPNKYEQVLDSHSEKQGNNENKVGNAAIANNRIHNEDTNLMRTQQNIENKTSHTSKGKRQMKAAKKDTSRASDTKYDTMIDEVNKTLDAARAMVDGVRRGYGIGSKKYRFESVMASIDDNQDYQESFLPVETLFQLTMDNYNDKRFRTKKKWKNKVKLQCQMHYQINMDEEMTATEQLTDNAHTLTDNVQTITDNVQTFTDSCQKLPIVDEESMRRRKMTKSRQVNSQGGGKASKGKERDNSARQSSRNIPELSIGAKPKPNSRNSVNENMIRAAMMKLPDDFIYTPKIKKQSSANQTSSEESRPVDRHQETEENHTGAEGGTQQESKKDPPKGALLSSESYVERNSGIEDPAKEAELSPESCVEQNSDTTVTETPPRGKRQQPRRKKIRKRRKARWY